MCEKGASGIDWQQWQHSWPSFLRQDMPARENPLASVSNHNEHGFLYPFGSSTESIVFWDSAMETFWWTSESQYPHVYRFSDGEWLWYLEGSSDPRWFVRLSDGVWEQW